MSSQQIYLYYPHYNSSLDIIPNLNSNENLKNDTLYDYDSFQNKEDKEKVFNEFFDFSLNKHSLRNDFNDDDDENRYTINKTRENTQTKVTKTKNNVFFMKKVKKVFLIKKKDKKYIKKGRWTKENRPKRQPKHGKNSVDNISLKIKRQFVEKIRLYINKKYKEYLLSKETEKSRQLLLKIIPNSYNIYQRENNNKYFEWPIYELFSANISNKYKKQKYSEDYNRKQIQKLFLENEAKEVIEIMKMTMKEIYIKYIHNEIIDFNLEKDLIAIGKKEGEDYKKLYQQRAKNLVYNFSRKKSIHYKN